MAKLNLDLSGVRAATGGADVVPAGNYNVQITDTEIVDKGQNAGLKVGFEVVDGEYKGAQLSNYYNIVHSNADTQRIALEQLKGLLELADLPSMKLDDSDVLHGKKYSAFIAEDSYTFNDQTTGKEVTVPTNRFKKIKKYAGTANMAESMGAPQSAPTTTPEPTKPAQSRPWA